MKNTILISSALLFSIVTSSNAQRNVIPQLRDSLTAKTQKTGKVLTTNFSKKNINKQVKHSYYGDSTTQFHIGWEDGRVPEFSNAYTLHRHEFRLNVLGRSSYAINNRFEVSSYLPLIFITPNVSLKYRFLDRRSFAAAIEAGTIRGLFPAAFATGILLPGAAIGVGTAGFIRGSDNHIKLYASWHPTAKLTFSAKGSVSFLKIGYIGLGGVAGVGGDGVIAGLFPINVKHNFKYLAGGIEADYVINKKNAIVFNSTISGFENANKQLLVSSLGWTHANTHFHYTVGLYNFLDPPVWDMWKAEKSHIPVGVYANVYWIFNNRIKNKPISIFENSRK
jgi:hypothetical protein